MFCLFARSSVCSALLRLVSLFFFFFSCFFARFSSLLRSFYFPPTQRRSRTITGSNITIRNTMGGLGYEKTFEVYDPLVEAIKVVEPRFLHGGKKRVCVVETEDRMNASRQESLFLYRFQSNATPLPPTMQRLGAAPNSSTFARSRARCRRSTLTGSGSKKQKRYSNALSTSVAQQMSAPRLEEHLVRNRSW